MRVTKVMREYVEKQLDEKRYALGAENRKAYDMRRKECCDLIREKITACRMEVDEILRSYNMDTPTKEREEKGWTNREVVGFYDGHISNSAELEQQRKYERELRDRQKEMLNAFYLECDLGINKEEFLNAVAAMNFD